MSEFWTRLDRLVAANPLVIDRPRGSAHPRYPQMVYTMDYGYLDGSRSGDGNGIDVWRGSDLGAGLVGVLCSVDIVKSDSEVKLLIDCTEGEIEAATRFMNNQYMSAIVVRRPR